MTEDDVKKVVHMTIDELRERDMLDWNRELNYRYTSVKLFEYFEKGCGSELLKRVENDPWIKIIYLFYRDRKTVEQTADEMGCDVSTVVRNKKRIVLEIYKTMKKAE